MEAWWHDFYSTMAQVTAVLLLATVVEDPIRSSIIGHKHWKDHPHRFVRFMAKPFVATLRIRVLITTLWGCGIGVGFALWTLGESDPPSLLISIGQWLVGLPTVILALLIAIGIILHIQDERAHSQNNVNSCQCGTSAHHHNNDDP
jgi:hypothetical protein